MLTDSKGEKSYYRAKGDKLEMLDRDGNPIESTLNYTLESVKSSLPITPMAMRGMYFYMADAATFTDCATGKRVAVANNAQLERDYAAARGTDTRPVLLVVEGTLRWKRTRIRERRLKFWRWIHQQVLSKEDCNSR